jgi:hypothetical protein
VPERVRVGWLGPVAAAGYVDVSPQLAAVFRAIARKRDDAVAAVTAGFAADPGDCRSPTNLSPMGARDRASRVTRP